MPKFPVYVDWSDSRYPSIRKWVEGCAASPLTLTEAKREIARRAAFIISHWQHIAKTARKVTESEIIA